MMDLLYQDYCRYPNKKAMPKYQKYMRKITQSKNIFIRLFYRFLFRLEKKKNLVDLSHATRIGGGLMIVHPYCITVNHHAVIGNNVNLHKGVTIGQENRGKRKGVPTIGNQVWIGMNAVIVGNIHIGDDVMIAANTFVNCDVPSHSVVYGNPCVIKPCNDATIGYIENQYISEE